jgi:SlyX protein
LERRFGGHRGNPLNRKSAILQASATPSGYHRRRDIQPGTGMESPLNERLNELEVKSAFTEDLLDALNATVYRQQQQIDRLLREVRELREQLATSAPAEGHSLRDEIPPHY